jgi:hypothetical protein
MYSKLHIEKVCRDPLGEIWFEKKKAGKLYGRGARSLKNVWVEYRFPEGLWRTLEEFQLHI